MWKKRLRILRRTQRGRQGAGDRDSIGGPAAHDKSGLPGIGTVIGALTMPVVSAGATWVIGKLFVQHFASGGTLLDFNPSDYREFMKEQKDKFAARSGSVAPTPESPTRPVKSAAAPAARSTPKKARRLRALNDLG